MLYVWQGLGVGRSVITNFYVVSLSGSLGSLGKSFLIVWDDVGDAELHYAFFQELKE